jgi:hypothetical protein
MHQVKNFLINDLRLLVESIHKHPLGIGLFQVETEYHRDLLLVDNPYEIDGVLVRFIRHDHDINRRSFEYSRLWWIFILGYPLEYKTLEHIDQVVATFGKMVSWHNNPNAKGFVLVKRLYNGIDAVLRSIVMGQGNLDGRGWCWSIPIYVLNWKHPDEFIEPIDDLPPDGNPHPMPPPQNQNLNEGAIAENLVNELLPDLQEDPIWNTTIQDEDHHAHNEGWSQWNQKQNEVQPHPKVVQEEVQVPSDVSGVHGDSSSSSSVQHNHYSTL